jgi:hypothetical protein
MILTKASPIIVIMFMLSSIVVSFVFAIIMIPFDRKHFFRYPYFWFRFMLTGTIFLLVDWLELEILW